MSELSLVGKGSDKKKEADIKKEIQSVHIGYSDFAIGIKSSKVFSSELQSYIFTSLLIIYQAVLKKN